MSQSSVCVIIPAFNEAARIVPVIEAANVHAPVIVVDDGSVDGTAPAAEKAGAHVIVQPVNQGKGAALAAGFNYAKAQGYEAVITMDADGQHDPAEIPVFMDAYHRTGCPVVVGNRMSDLKDMPLIRRWTNKTMSWMLSRRMGQHVPDTQCGYRLYRSDVLHLLDTGSQGFAAESEVLLNLAAHGVAITSTPIRTIYGDETSKIHPVRDTIRFFGMLRRYRKPQR